VGKSKSCSSLICSLLLILLIETPAFAQTVCVRLFEIFHPKSIEISAAKSSVSRPLNRLRIMVNHDSLSQTETDWMRIDLAASGLQIKGQDFVRSFRSSDTLKVATTAGYFIAVLSDNKPQTKKQFSQRLDEPNSAGGTLSVGFIYPLGAKNSSSINRSYSGNLKIYARGKELCIVNLVSLDEYLAGILAAEMPQAESAALQAQAVVARTFIIKNWARHANTGYQFCDLTHCQVYKGSDGVTPKMQQAVINTNDEILVYHQQPIEAYYSSTCGGRAADDNGVWANPKDQPYLKSQADSNFCAHSPHYRWRVKISADSLHQIWQRRLGAPINAITISKKDADGRVRELALMDHSLHLITGEDFRAVTCRVLGWNTVKSTAFDLRIEKNIYIFTGRGLGHGLGLCQYGAMEMARRGYSYREILRHYFPETEIQKYSE